MSVSAFKDVHTLSEQAVMSRPIWLLMELHKLEKDMISDLSSLPSTIGSHSLEMRLLNLDRSMVIVVEK